MFELRRSLGDTAAAGAAAPAPLAAVAALGRKMRNLRRSERERTPMTLLLSSVTTRRWTSCRAIRSEIMATDSDLLHDITPSNTVGLMDSFFNGMTVMRR